MSSSANGINNQENLTVQPLSLHDQVLAGIIESSEQTLSLQNEVWSTDYTYQDGEWKNIDAVKFGEQFKKIQAFYNMLAVLAELIEMQAELRDIVNVYLAGIRVSGGSTSDLSETAVNEGRLTQKYTVLYFSKQLETVETYNQKVLNQKLEEAKKKAKKKAKRSWFSIVFFITDALGITGVKKGAEAYYFSKYARDIYNQYYQHVRKIFNSFSALLEVITGRSGVTTGDPVLDAINARKNAIIQELTYDNLTVAAGTGYRDLDKNKIMAMRIAMVAFQNFFNVYLMIREIRQVMRNAVTQMMTGVSVGEGHSEMAITINQTLASFENQAFSLAIDQLFKTVSAYDQFIYYQKLAKKNKIRFGFSWIPFIGQWLGAEIAHSIVADQFTPSRLNMGEVWDLIYKKYGIRRGNSVEEVLSILEQKAWELLGQLEDTNSFKLDAGDGFQAINETAIARIHEQLADLVNIRTVITLVARMKGKLRDVVIQEMTEAIGSYKTDPEVLREMIKAENESIRLAMDMHIDTIRKEIAEHNRKRQEELELQALRKGALLGSLLAVVFVALAIILGVFTVGAGAVAIILAISIFMAGWSLGQSIAQYDYAKAREKNIKTDFHSTDLLYIGGQDAFEERISRAFRKATDWHSFFEDAGNEYVAINPAKAMEFRTELTALYIVQMVLLMMAKAKQNLRDIVTQTMGHAGTGDLLTEAGAVLDEKYKTWVSIYNLAMQMIAEEASFHNQLTKAKHDAALAGKMLTLAIIGSVVSLVAPVLGTVGAVISAATQIVCAVLRYQMLEDAAKKEDQYGRLKDYYEEQEIIHLITQPTGNAAWDALSRAEKEAMLLMTLDLIESVGHGYFGLDTESVEKLKHRMEGIYRAKETLIYAAHGKAELRRVVRRAMGRMIGESYLTDVLSALDAERDNAFNVLDMLEKKIEAYIERLNEVNDREKAAYMAKISMIFTIVRSIISLGLTLASDGSSSFSYAQAINGVVLSDGVANYIALSEYDSKVSKTKNKKSAGVGTSVYDGQSNLQHSDLLAAGLQKFENLAYQENLELARLEFLSERTRRDLEFQDELDQAINSIVASIVQEILSLVQGNLAKKAAINRAEEEQINEGQGTPQAGSAPSTVPNQPAPGAEGAPEAAGSAPGTEDDQSGSEEEGDNVDGDEAPTTPTTPFNISPPLTTQPATTVDDLVRMLDRPAVNNRGRVKEAKVDEKNTEKIAEQKRLARKREAARQQERKAAAAKAAAELARLTDLVVVPFTPDTLAETTPRLGTDVYTVVQAYDAGQKSELLVPQIIEATVQKKFEKPVKLEMVVAPNGQKSYQIAGTGQAVDTNLYQIFKNTKSGKFFAVAKNNWVPATVKFNEKGQTQLISLKNGKILSKEKFLVIFSNQTAAGGPQVQGGLVSGDEYQKFLSLVAEGQFEQANQMNLKFYAVAKKESQALPLEQMVMVNPRMVAEFIGGLSEPERVEILTQLNFFAGEKNSAPVWENFDRILSEVLANEKAAGAKDSLTIKTFTELRRLVQEKIGVFNVQQRKNFQQLKDFNQRVANTLAGGAQADVKSIKEVVNKLSAGGQGIFNQLATPTVVADEVKVAEILSAASLEDLAQMAGVYEEIGERIPGLRDLAGAANQAVVDKITERVRQLSVTEPEKAAQIMVALEPKVAARVLAQLTAYESVSLARTISEGMLRGEYKLVDLKKIKLLGQAIQKNEIENHRTLGMLGFDLQNKPIDSLGSAGVKLEARAHRLLSGRAKVAGAILGNKYLAHLDRKDARAAARKTAEVSAQLLLRYNRKLLPEVARGNAEKITEAGQFFDDLKKELEAKRVESVEYQAIGTIIKEAQPIIQGLILESSQKNILVESLKQLEMAIAGYQVAEYKKPEARGGDTEISLPTRVALKQIAERLVTQFREEQDREKAFKILNDLPVPVVAYFVRDLEKNDLQRLVTQEKLQAAENKIAPVEKSPEGQLVVLRAALSEALVELKKRPEPLKVLDERQLGTIFEQKVEARVQAVGQPGSAPSLEIPRGREESLQKIIETDKLAELLKVVQVAPEVVLKALAKYEAGSKVITPEVRGKINDLRTNSLTVLADRSLAGLSQENERLFIAQAKQLATDGSLFERIKLFTEILPKVEIKSDWIARQDLVNLKEQLASQISAEIRNNFKELVSSASPDQIKEFGKAVAVLLKNKPQQLSVQDLKNWPSIKIADQGIFVAEIMKNAPQAAAELIHSLPAETRAVVMSLVVGEVARSKPELMPLVVELVGKENLTDKLNLTPVVAQIVEVASRNNDSLVIANVSQAMTELVKRQVITPEQLNEILTPAVDYRVKNQILSAVIAGLPESRRPEVLEKTIVANLSQDFAQISDFCRKLRTDKSTAAKAGDILQSLQQEFQRISSPQVMGGVPHQVAKVEMALAILNSPAEKIMIYLSDLKQQNVFEGRPEQIKNTEQAIFNRIQPAMHSFHLTEVVPIIRELPTQTLKDQAIVEVAHRVEKNPQDIFQLAVSADARANRQELLQEAIIAYQNIKQSRPEEVPVVKDLIKKLSEEKLNSGEFFSLVAVARPEILSEFLSQSQLTKITQELNQLLGSRAMVKISPAGIKKTVENYLDEQAKAIEFTKEPKKNFNKLITLPADVLQLVINRLDREGLANVIGQEQLQIAERKIKDVGKITEAGKQLEILRVAVGGVLVEFKEKARETKGPELLNNFGQAVATRVEQEVQKVTGQTETGQQFLTRERQPEVPVDAEPAVIRDKLQKLLEVPPDRFNQEVKKFVDKFDTATVLQVVKDFGQKQINRPEVQKNLDEIKLDLLARKSVQGELKGADVEEFLVIANKVATEGKFKDQTRLYFEILPKVQVAEEYRGKIETLNHELVLKVTDRVKNDLAELVKEPRNIEQFQQLGEQVGRLINETLIKPEELKVLGVIAKPEESVSFLAGVIREAPQKTPEILQNVPVNERPRVLASSLAFISQEKPEVIRQVIVTVGQENIPEAEDLVPVIAETIMKSARENNQVQLNNIVASLAILAEERLIRTENLAAISARLQNPEISGRILAAVAVNLRKEKRAEFISAVLSRSIKNLDVRSVEVFCQQISKDKVVADETRRILENIRPSVEIAALGVDSRMVQNLQQQQALIERALAVLNNPVPEVRTGSDKELETILNTLASEPTSPGNIQRIISEIRSMKITQAVVAAHNLPDNDVKDRVMVTIAEGVLAKEEPKEEVANLKPVERHGLLEDSLTSYKNLIATGRREDAAKVQELINLILRDGNEAEIIAAVFNTPVAIYQQVFNEDTQRTIQNRVSELSGRIIASEPQEVKKAVENVVGEKAKPIEEILRSANPEPQLALNQLASLPEALIQPVINRLDKKDVERLIGSENYSRILERVPERTAPARRDEIVKQALAEIITREKDRGGKQTILEVPNLVRQLEQTVPEVARGSETEGQNLSGEKQPQVRVGAEPAVIRDELQKLLNISSEDEFSRGVKNLANRYEPEIILTVMNDMELKPEEQRKSDVLKIDLLAQKSVQGELKGKEAETFINLAERVKDKGTVLEQVKLYAEELPKVKLVGEFKEKAATIRNEVGLKLSERIKSDFQGLVNESRSTEDIKQLGQVVGQLLQDKQIAVKDIRDVSVLRIPERQVAFVAEIMKVAPQAAPEIVKSLPRQEQIRVVADSLIIVAKEKPEIMKDLAPVIKAEGLLKIEEFIPVFSKNIQRTAQKGEVVVLDNLGSSLAGLIENKIIKVEQLPVILENLKDSEVRGKFLAGIVLRLNQENRTEFLNNVLPQEIRRLDFRSLEVFCQQVRPAITVADETGKVLQKITPTVEIPGLAKDSRIAQNLKGQSEIVQKALTALSSPAPEVRNYLAELRQRGVFENPVALQKLVPEMARRVIPQLRSMTLDEAVAVTHQLPAGEIKDQAVVVVAEEVFSKEQPQAEVRKLNSEERRGLLVDSLKTYQNLKVADKPREAQEVKELVNLLLNDKRDEEVILAVQNTPVEIYREIFNLESQNIIQERVSELSGQRVSNEPEAIKKTVEDVVREKAQPIEEILRSANPEPQLALNQLAALPGALIQPVINRLDKEEVKKLIDSENYSQIMKKIPEKVDPVRRDEIVKLTLAEVLIKEKERTGKPVVITIQDLVKKLEQEIPQVVEKSQAEGRRLTGQEKPLVPPGLEDQHNPVITYLQKEAVVIDVKDILKVKDTETFEKAIQKFVKELKIAEVVPQEVTAILNEIKAKEPSEENKARLDQLIAEVEKMGQAGAGERVNVERQPGLRRVVREIPRIISAEPGMRGELRLQLESAPVRGNFVEQFQEAIRQARPEDLRQIAEAVKTLEQEEILPPAEIQKFSEAFAVQVIKVGNREEAQQIMAALPISVQETISQVSPVRLAVEIKDVREVKDLNILGSSERKAAFVAQVLKENPQAAPLIIEKLPDQEKSVVLVKALIKVAPEKPALIEVALEKSGLSEILLNSSDKKEISSLISQEVEKTDDFSNFVVIGQLTATLEKRGILGTGETKKITQEIMGKLVPVLEKMSPEEILSQINRLPEGEIRDQAVIKLADNFAAQPLRVMAIIKNLPPLTSDIMLDRVIQTAEALKKVPPEIRKPQELNQTRELLKAIVKEKLNTGKDAEIFNVVALIPREIYQDLLNDFSPVEHQKIQQAVTRILPEVGFKTSEEAKQVVDNFVNLQVSQVQEQLRLKEIVAAIKKLSELPAEIVGPVVFKLDQKTVEEFIGSGNYAKSAEKIPERGLLIRREEAVKQALVNAIKNGKEKIGQNLVSTVSEFREEVTQEIPKVLVGILQTIVLRQPEIFPKVIERNEVSVPEAAKMIEKLPVAVKGPAVLALARKIKEQPDELKRCPPAVRDVLFSEAVKTVKTPAVQELVKTIAQQKLRDGEVISAAALTPVEWYHEIFSAGEQEQIRQSIGEIVNRNLENRPEVVKSALEEFIKNQAKQVGTTKNKEESLAELVSLPGEIQRLVIGRLERSDLEKLLGGERLKELETRISDSGRIRESGRQQEVLKWALGEVLAKIRKRPEEIEKENLWPRFDAQLGAAVESKVQEVTEGSGAVETRLGEKQAQEQPGPEEITEPVITEKEIAASREQILADLKLDTADIRPERSAAIGPQFVGKVRQTQKTVDLVALGRLVAELKDNQVITDFEADLINTGISQKIERPSALLPLPQAINLIDRLPEGAARNSAVQKIVSRMWAHPEQLIDLNSVEKDFLLVEVARVYEKIENKEKAKSLVTALIKEKVKNQDDLIDVYLQFPLPVFQEVVCSGELKTENTKFLETVSTMVAVPPATETDPEKFQKVVEELRKSLLGRADSVREKLQTGDIASALKNLAELPPPLAPVVVGSLSHASLEKLVGPELMRELKNRLEPAGIKEPAKQKKFLARVVLKAIPDLKKETESVAVARSRMIKTLDQMELPEIRRQIAAPTPAVVLENLPELIDRFEKEELKVEEFEGFIKQIIRHETVPENIRLLSRELVDSAGNSSRLKLLGKIVDSLVEHLPAMKPGLRVQTEEQLIDLREKLSQQLFRNDFYQKFVRKPKTEERLFTQIVAEVASDNEKQFIEYYEKLKPEEKVIFLRGLNDDLLKVDEKTLAQVEQKIIPVLERLSKEKPLSQAVSSLKQRLVRIRQNRQLVRELIKQPLEKVNDSVKRFMAAQSAVAVKEFFEILSGEVAKMTGLQLVDLKEKVIPALGNSLKSSAARRQLALIEETVTKKIAQEITLAKENVFKKLTALPQRTLKDVFVQLPEPVKAHLRTALNSSRPKGAQESLLEVLCDSYELAKESAESAEPVQLVSKMKEKLARPVGQEQFLAELFRRIQNTRDEKQLVGLSGLIHELKKEKILNLAEEEELILNRFSQTVFKTPAEALRILEKLPADEKIEEDWRWKLFQRWSPEKQQQVWKYLKEQPPEKQRVFESFIRELERLPGNLALQKEAAPAALVDGHSEPVLRADSGAIVAGAAQVFEGGNNYGSGDSSGDNPDQIIDKLLKLLEQEETIPAEEILQLVQEARTAFEDKVFLGDYRGDNLHRLGNRLTVLGERLLTSEKLGAAGTGDLLESLSDFQASVAASLEVLGEARQLPESDLTLLYKAVLRFHRASERVKVESAAEKIDSAKLEKISQEVVDSAEGFCQIVEKLGRKYGIKEVGPQITQIKNAALKAKIELARNATERSFRRVLEPLQEVSSNINLATGHIADGIPGGEKVKEKALLVANNIGRNLEQAINNLEGIYARRQSQKADFSWVGQVSHEGLKNYLNRLEKEFEAGRLSPNDLILNLNALGQQLGKDKVTLLAQLYKKVGFVLSDTEVTLWEPSLPEGDLPFDRHLFNGKVDFRPDVIGLKQQPQLTEKEGPLFDLLEKCRIDVDGLQLEALQLGDNLIEVGKKLKSSAVIADRLSQGGQNFEQGFLAIDFRRLLTSKEEFFKFSEIFAGFESFVNEYPFDVKGGRKLKQAVSQNLGRIKEKMGQLRKGQELAEQKSLEEIFEVAVAASDLATVNQEISGVLDSLAGLEIEQQKFILERISENISNRQFNPAKESNRSVILKADRLIEKYDGLSDDRGVAARRIKGNLIEQLARGLTGDYEGKQKELESLGLARYEDSLKQGVAEKLLAERPLAVTPVPSPKKKFSRIAAEKEPARKNFAGQLVEILQSFFRGRDYVEENSQKISEVSIAREDIPAAKVDLEREAEIVTNAADKHQYITKV